MAGLVRIVGRRPAGWIKPQLSAQSLSIPRRASAAAEFAAAGSRLFQLTALIRAPEHMCLLLDTLDTKISMPRRGQAATPMARDLFSTRGRVGTIRIKVSPNRMSGGTMAALDLRYFPIASTMVIGPTFTYFTIRYTETRRILSTQEAHPICFFTISRQFQPTAHSMASWKI